MVGRDSRLNLDCDDIFICANISYNPDDGVGNGERLGGREPTEWSLVVAPTPESCCSTEYMHPLVYRDEVKGVGRPGRTGGTRQSLRGRTGKEPGIDKLFEDVTCRCSEPGLCTYHALSNAEEFRFYIPNYGYSLWILRPYSQNEIDGCDRRNSIRRLVLSGFRVDITQVRAVEPHNSICSRKRSRLGPSIVLLEKLSRLGQPD
ncbi:hypothetical protein BJV78DRAFT_560440 [Lactifluus subvellereus]|nr:hypothetical protein BJV78DRAFT_560440 [Lactifluus subvellereus]